MLFSVLKNIFSKIAVILIISLTAICFFQHKKVQQLDTELSYVTNNYEYYKDLTDSINDNNRTLKLTIDQFKQSNDSLIQQTKQIQKELNIKNKNLQQVQVINTQMKDTAQTIIKPQLIDFNEKLTLNDLTTITVTRKDSILTAILDLRNQQILFVEEKKQFRNHYKNWFQRFIHFDWKKDRIRKYQIHNTNDLIKVTDTRVIEIVK